MVESGLEVLEETFEVLEVKGGGFVHKIGQFIYGKGYVRSSEGEVL